LNKENLRMTAYCESPGRSVKKEWRTVSAGW
jgi:hypothetical protein